MRIAQINSRMTGSPGMLMEILSDFLTTNSIENRMFFTFGNSVKENAYKYSNESEIKANALLSRITGRYGFVSVHATKRIIELLDDYKPDIIHLHTVHGHDFHTLKFFQYIKEKNIPVVYTIHDTWPFTGYCPNYDWFHCDQWKTECNTCPAYKAYSWFFDQSTKNFCDKKYALLSLKNLQIVTPSHWMKSQVEQSYLKNISRMVIPNGIDTGVFTPVSSNSKDKIGISDKYMILSLANAISKDKGLMDLIELSKILPEDYVLILVGVSEELKTQLPSNILSFPRTSRKEELVQYYSAADVLVNPTHGDNFPTVNLESLACGTPVVTYDVGGSPESLDSYTGIAVPENDINELKNAVIKMAENKKSCTDKCRDRAVQLYDKGVFARSYLNLYKKILDTD